MGGPSWSLWWSPWYSHNGWLGVKHQVTFPVWCVPLRWSYLPLCCNPHNWSYLPLWYVPSDWFYLHMCSVSTNWSYLPLWYVPSDWFYLYMCSVSTNWSYLAFLIDLISLCAGFHFLSGLTSFMLCFFCVVLTNNTSLCALSRLHPDITSICAVMLSQWPYLPLCCTALVI